MVWMELEEMMATGIIACMLWSSVVCTVHEMSGGSGGRECDWQDMWHSWHVHMERSLSNICSKRKTWSCWVQIILKWTPTILSGLDYMLLFLDNNRH
jgi:hypothetical protein